METDLVTVIETDSIDAIDAHNVHYIPALVMAYLAEPQGFPPGCDIQNAIKSPTLSGLSDGGRGRVLLQPNHTTSTHRPSIIAAIESTP